MANEVRIRVVAEDKTKGVFGGVKAGMKGVLTGAAALGGGIALAMVKASGAAREAAKVHAQTAAVIKSTGGAANITAKQMEGMATRISNLSGLDDELVLSGYKVLATFRNIRNETGKGNDIFNQATVAITDMSVALGKDMKSSAILVGKALNDPVKGMSALTRAGVQFTDEQKKTIAHLIKTGKTAEAQKIILAELRAEFGGSAEAQATWADKAKVAAENIEESFGDLVNKTFAPIGKWFVEEGAPAVQDFIDKVSKDKDLKRSLKDLGDALKGLTDKDIAGTLHDIAEELPKVIEGFAKLTTKLGEAHDAITKFEDATSKEEGGPLGGMANAVARNIKKLGSAIEGGWDKMTVFVVAKAGELKDKVVAKAGELKDKFVHRFKTMWGEAKDSFKKDNRQIVDGVKNFVGRVAGWFSRLGGRLKTSTIDMLTSIKSSWKTRTGEIADRVSGWKDRLVATAKRLSSNLRSGISDMLTSIKNRFRNSTGDIADRVSNWKDRLVTTGKRLSSSLRGVISDMLTRMKDRFHSGVDAIGRAWDDLKAKARGPVKFVIQSVLNGGLIRAFNIIAGALHVRKLDPVHVPRGWASGTSKVLPGYTPGRDVHRFYSATGGVMDLSGGEGIARPELVRAVGKRRWDAANKAARNGRVDEGLHYLGGYAKGSSGIDAAKAEARREGFHRITTYPGHGELGMQYSWDFMTNNRSQGERFANWLWANRKAIHLWYEIYYRRIRSMTRPGAGWRPYRRQNPHTDHVHASFYRSGLGGLVGALSRGGAALIDYVKRFGSKIAGPMKRLAGLGNHPWAKMLRAAGGRLKDAMLNKVKDAMKSLAASAVGGGFTAAAGGSNRAIGRRMMLQRWPASQWPPLNSLWTKESGWNTHALNRSSGAYGIPQSLPGSKMASAGSDWRNNPATQIKWGLGYIRSRYGSPSAAWRHSQRTNWYDRGGMLPSGGVALNASGLPERVLSPAMTKSFDRLVRVMDRGRGAGAGNTYITVNAPNYVGSQDDLRRTLVDMNRRGQLEVIKRR